MDSALIVGGRTNDAGCRMDYKDYLEQSKRRLDHTLDRLKQRNESILGSYGISVKPKNESSRRPERGVILTDSFKLSKEYGCQKEDILEIIHRYMNNRADAGFHWYLLDLSDPDVDRTNGVWEEIISVISVFNARNSICSPGSPVPLFIIGNHAVVPMPRMENPTPGAIGGEFLDVDYRYAFEAEGDEEDYSPFMTEPSYFVGRIPVPFFFGEGEGELSEYLDSCIQLEDEGGMEVEETSMVSTESWIPSSHDMVADIPISKVDTASELSVEGKLILSPTLDVNDWDTYQPFSEIARKADYMVFNLHGSDVPEQSSYFGEDINHSYLTEAFNIELLLPNAPRVFISTACFGARFINYAFDESMLLYAMSNGTLLFVGSCVIALGDPEGAGYSEYLTKLLNVYLHKGIPAGEAFSRAKEDYYREKSETEDPMYSLFTNMEFNLFGNPVLSMKPKLPMDYVPKGTNKDAFGRLSVPTYKEYKNKILVKISADTGGDILSQVRTEVDRGLERISQTIQEELYDRIGLQGIELDSIIEYDSGTDRGYYYTYSKRYGKLSTKVIAKTDQAGIVRRLILTK